MQKVIMVFVMVIAFLLSAPIQASAFTNGSFESGLAGWENYNVDVGSWWLPSHGSYCVDLSGMSAGWVRQSFSTNPGSTYAVSFDMAGNMYSSPTIKTMVVDILDASSVSLYSQQYTFNTTGWSGANASSFNGWEYHSLLFTATSDITTLKFTSLINTAYGPSIDNVQVYTTTIPEPSCMFLFVMALAVCLFKVLSKI